MGPLPVMDAVNTQAMIKAVYMRQVSYAGLSISVDGNVYPLKDAALLALLAGPI